jgi:hypothetical protein
MKRSRTLRILAMAFVAAMFVGVQAFAEPNPERNAYFGETHQHTS